MKAQQQAQPLPVTVENFTRAESDLYFSNIVKRGSLGRFHHDREPADIKNQTVIRLNRDTLYSSAVFDLNAGPVTITLPDTGKRFRSMQVINEDPVHSKRHLRRRQLHPDEREDRNTVLRGSDSYACRSGMQTVR
jgi:hypothetical protein